MLKEQWNALMKRLFGGGNRPTKDELLGGIKAAHGAGAREKAQAAKRQTRYTYTEGPMYFLGQQIVRLMQDAGYPAKIIYGYRSPEEQADLYAKGRSRPGKIVTNAPAWASPHNYHEAVDIIHESRGWNVSDDFWDSLAACVRTVEDKFGVDLGGGFEWGWDLAHVQTSDWKAVRRRRGKRVATPDDLWQRFHELLPDVAARYERDHMGPPYVVAIQRAGGDARQAVESWRAEAGRD